MKIYTFILTLAASAVLFTSCDDMNREDQYKPIDDLEAYVESVEDTVENDAAVNWQAIEARYAELQAQADQAFADEADRDEEVNRRLAEIEDRFENTKEEYRHSEMRAESEEKLSELERWAEESADEIESASEPTRDSIHATFENMSEWFRTNYNELEEDTKRRFDDLDRRFSDDEEVVD